MSGFSNNWWCWETQSFSATVVDVVAVMEDGCDVRSVKLWWCVCLQYKSSEKNPPRSENLKGRVVAAWYLDSMWKYSGPVITLKYSVHMFVQKKVCKGLNVENSDCSLWCWGINSHAEKRKRCRRASLVSPTSQTMLSKQVRDLFWWRLLLLNTLWGHAVKKCAAEERTTHATRNQQHQKHLQMI